MVMWNNHWIIYNAADRIRTDDRVKLSRASVGCDPTTPQLLVFTQKEIILIQLLGGSIKLKNLLRRVLIKIFQDYIKLIISDIIAIANEIGTIIAIRCDLIFVILALISAFSYLFSY